MHFSVISGRHSAVLLEGGAEIAFAGISEPYADFLEADVFVNYQLADPFHSFVGNVFGR